jgi:hypothetical protein
MSLVLTLASRNLFQDRLRFIATSIGIVFSVVLVMVQMGLYLGFGRMVTAMIDHAAADLWVVSKSASSFEDLTLLDIRTRDRLPGINGVAAVIPVVIGFADWRRQSDGRVKPAFVRSPRSPGAHLQRVHRGLRHARSEGGKGTARRAVPLICRPGNAQILIPRNSLGAPLLSANEGD